MKLHELPGDAPLLLSHKHQGQLCIILCTRGGVARFKDHPDGWARVRRAAGPGLSTICISDFANHREHEEPPAYRRFYRGGVVHSSNDLSTSDGGDICGYMAMPSAHPSSA